jgi:Tfp pilus assembly protein PilF
MSLINQMLRDLENRNTANTPSSLQHNVQIIQPTKSNIPFIGICLLAALITTAGIYWAYQNSTLLVKKPATAVADSTISKAPAPIAPYEKILAAPNAVTESSAKPELKLPENSLVTLSSVSPPNSAPQASPKPSAQTSSTNQQTQPNSAVQSAPIVQTNTVVSPSPVVQTNSSALAAQPIQTPPSPSLPSEKAPEQPAIKAPTISKPTSTKLVTAKQQADLLYTQAENNPDDYSAIIKLEQALQLDPRHLKARLLLAKTLHNHGQVSKTAEFLDQSLILFPDNLQFINTRAQLYLQQKNPNGALKTLQFVNSASSTNETYLSLLAATYQQMGAFANSSKIYQKLVAINPDKAESWLGLALSHEKLGNLKLARDAYQQALNKNTLKGSIINFIKQKLAELG